MRFLANENFPRASVFRLREAGYEVLAIQEKDPGALDPVVLDYAARENLVLLTFDRDYGELIYRRHLASPRGVLHLRFIPLTPEEPAEVILNLCRSSGWSSQDDIRSQSGTRSGSDRFPEPAPQLRRRQLAGL